MKKNRTVRRLMALLLTLMLLLQLPVAAQEAPPTQAEQGESTAEPVAAPTADASYAAYRQYFADQAPGEDDLLLTPDRMTGGEQAKIETVDGKTAVATAENGYVEYTFSIQTAGKYVLHLDYYPLEGKSVAMERGVMIDGAYPFQEAQVVTFPRVWKDAVVYNNGFTFDNNGNELRPSQVEAPEWVSTAVQDSSGYYNKPYEFYLTAGEHTLRLVSLREPMAVGDIRLKKTDTLPSYAEKQAQYAQKGYTPAAGNQPVILQAENSKRKSQPTIYPLFDRTSPLTQPCDFDSILLNTIGSSNWQYTGDWITWEVTVPQTGLYTLAFRARNNLVSGRAVTRRLYIDGEVPFAEADALLFPYDSDWQLQPLSDGDTVFQFYFEAGKTYELKLEVTLGDFADILRRVQESSLNLNYVYRQILMITGSSPDPYRDYDIDLALPECMDILREELSRLRQVITDIEAVSGEGGAYLSPLSTMCIRIENMLKRPDKIPVKFADFKNCIVSLGSWLLSAQEQPLEMDYIALLPEKAETPRAEAGFFEKMWMQIRLFVSSFFNDYNTIGSISDAAESVEVWTSAGRDQATIIKGLVSNYFEQETGIHVNLKLVAAGALLPSILAGNNPDVFLSATGTDPINYALRGAVRSLNEFEGIDEIVGRFHESALVPFTYDGQIYALPETQTFPMLFYREDILTELGLSLPETWDDVIDMLSELSHNNMQFGLPAAATAQMNVLDLTVFWTLILQNGGQIYADDRSRILLDSETCLDAFQTWTGFYADYGQDYTFDFATRFRMGEMPIGIADYSMYNTLSVFAPEIKGLWSFTTVPGTRQADGTVDHTVAGGGNATIMMKAARNPEGAWKFMEWWCRAQTQFTYGRELESVMGTAARYPAANLEAAAQMPWTGAELDELLKQWEYVKGVPEVPGSYLTNREINFAFRSVLIFGTDPREALLDHTININNEITRKRKEFKLS